MVTDDQPVISSLLMDRSSPLGNSDDVFNRRSLHVKVANKITEAIPVFLDVASPNSEAISAFNEISALAAGSETLITTYTVPAAVSFFLQRVCVSGTNVAIYRVKVDGTTQDKMVTYFSGPLSDSFDFTAGAERGLKLNSGQVVTVTVIHARPTVGDFSARIQGVEQDLS